MRLTLVHLHPWDRENEDRINLYMRSERPCALLTQEGGFEAVSVPWNHPDAPELACAADVLVLHALSDMALEAVVDWRKARGKATLYEISDDMNAPGPWRRYPEPSPLVMSRCFHLAARCDGVQFSTAALQRKYAILSKRTQVLPNLVEIPAKLPEKPPGFTIGWAGSSSHQEDLRPIVPVLLDLVQRHPGIELALKGDLKMLHDLFGEAPHDRIRFEGFGPPASYYNFLETVHAGPIPLAATTFNEGRTDLKLLEFAAAGVAAVVQRSTAYGAHLEQILSFETPEELGAILERLYLHPEELQAERERIHTYALATSGLASTLQTHAAWYLSHAPASSGGALAARAAWASEAMEAVRRLREQDSPEEKYVEEVLQLLERYPSYLQLRLLAVQVLVRAGRHSQALALARPLLRSVMYRDSALMIALAAAPPAERGRFRKRLRSAALRALSLPFDREHPAAFARTVLEDAPYDYFSVMLCSRTPSPDLPQALLAEIQQRAALFVSK